VTVENALCTVAGEPKLLDFRPIAGAAYAYKTDAEAAKTPPGVKEFAGAHGTPAQ
jgi:hypothetical protein